jgi:hypothetical protein
VLAHRRYLTLFAFTVPVTEASASGEAIIASLIAATLSAVAGLGAAEARRTKGARSKAAESFILLCRWCCEEFLADWLNSS